VTIIGIMGLGIMICFRLKVETLIIPFRLIPLFLCFNLVQSPKANHPFVFLIQDKYTGTVLFLGRFATPELV
jgi:hypothetical protein